jgi:hypothetical protein
MVDLDAAVVLDAGKANKQAKLICQEDEAT